VKAEVNGVTIIDDFRASPNRHRADDSSLARSLSKISPMGRARTALQHHAPQRASGRAGRSLALADQVVVAAIFKSEAIPAAERLDLHCVIGEIQKRGKQARILADADHRRHHRSELRPRDVVAILSNGGFGGIYESYRNACARSARRRSG